MEHIAGGIIPPADVIAMKDLGVDAIFTPGTQRHEILSTIGKYIGIEEGSAHDK